MVSFFFFSNLFLDTNQTPNINELLTMIIPAIFTDHWKKTYLSNSNVSDNPCSRSDPWVEWSESTMYWRSPNNLLLPERLPNNHLFQVELCIIGNLSELSEPFIISSQNLNFKISQNAV